MSKNSSSKEIVLSDGRRVRVSGDMTPEDIAELDSKLSKSRAERGVQPVIGAAKAAAPHMRAGAIAAGDAAANALLDAPSALAEMASMAQGGAQYMLDPRSPSYPAAKSAARAKMTALVPPLLLNELQAIERGGPTSTEQLSGMAGAVKAGAQAMSDEVRALLSGQRSITGRGAPGLLWKRQRGEGMLDKIEEGFYQGALEHAEAFEKLREEFPIAASLGGDLGNLAGILALKRGRMGDVERALAGESEEIAAKAAPGLARLLTRTGKGIGMPQVARGLARAGEAGIEGAWLTIHQKGTEQGDAETVAALMAGTQVGGSLALTLNNAVFFGDKVTPGTLAGRMVGAALLFGGLTQIGKEYLPGGKDWILPSMESGFEKVALTMAVGAAAGALGMGRMRGTKFFEDAPTLVETITAVPRSLIANKYAEWTKADPETRDRMSKAVQYVATLPEVFTSKERYKIRRAMTDAGASLRNAVESLNEEGELQRKLDAIDRTIQKHSKEQGKK